MEKSKGHSITHHKFSDVSLQATAVVMKDKELQAPAAPLKAAEEPRGKCIIAESCQW